MVCNNGLLYKTGLLCSTMVLCNAEVLWKLGFFIPLGGRVTLNYCVTLGLWVTLACCVTLGCCVPLGMYVYGVVVPLYSCLPTLREQYMSQNWDNVSTTTIQLWSSEAWSCAFQFWDNPCGGERGLRLATTCDSAHTWQLYSAASLGHQATSTISLFWHWANQSLHYPNNASLGRDT